MTNTNVNGYLQAAQTQLADVNEYMDSPAFTTESGYVKVLYGQRRDLLVDLINNLSQISEADPQ